MVVGAAYPVELEAHKIEIGSHFYFYKMKPIRYDELVLGKEYIIKKDGIVYTGTYYMHYLK